MALRNNCFAEKLSQVRKIDKHTYTYNTIITADDSK